VNTGEVSVRPSPGLSSAEAARRLQRLGPNEIADRDRTSFAATLRAIVTEPMFALLLAAAGVYLALGDLGEGLLLGVFALATIGLVVFQERRSERALDALRELAVPQVRVIRDGVLRRLPARELVPGDAFRVDEGERVAADAVLWEASGLSVDESLLTGESVPVRKRVAALAEDLPAVSEPGGDDLPVVYAGTLVVAGHGIAVVVRTGRESHVGRIGASIASIDRAPTALEAQLRHVVRAFGIGAFVVCAFVVAWYGTVRNDWVQAFLSGIALAMAMLPEEFPLALAVLLGLGAWRLTHVNVLARRPAVIEALGAATVLCVDKTGTLTENRMLLRRLVSDAEDLDLAGKAVCGESTRRLLGAAVLASNRSGVEPMDRAIVERGDSLLAGSDHLHADWLLEREYPLRPELLAVTHLWRASATRHQLAAKGAPEAIVDLCRLHGAARTKLLERASALASEGLRVLAVAQGVPPQARPLDRPHDAEFALVGLLGFEDPVRPSVPHAVADARAAGITVVMITGDHLGTALAVAAQAGIDTAGGALMGSEIDRLDDEALCQTVRDVRVFARVRPEQKLRLVRAFRANGEVVAMTGDGVNDAPALKAADIGIAMAVRGTDVAREAASLVLLDEDFRHIVDGVRVGRRIFANLRKVMRYITAIHVPIAGLALLPLAFGWPPLLLPAHVALIEMVIDPICSLAFEGLPGEAGLMLRPPRPVHERLVGWPTLWRGFLQGFCVLVAVLAVDRLALPALGEEAARTLSFVALTSGNLFLVWANASTDIGGRALLQRSFAAFWVVAATAATAIAAAIAIEPLRRLLHFDIVPVSAVAMAVTAAAASVVVAYLLTRPRRSAAIPLGAAVATA
jgi:Ca2+-transporting ATPase